MTGKLLLRAVPIIALVVMAAIAFVVLSEDESTPDSVAAAAGPRDTWQTFSLEDNSLQFELPAEWYADHQGAGIAITNNEALLEVNRPNIASGDLLVYIYGYSPASLIGLEDEASPATAVELVVQSQSGQGDFQPVEALSLSDYEGAESQFTTTRSDGAYLVLDVDGTMLTVASVTPVGEYSDHAETVRDIAGSIIFDPTIQNVDEWRIFQETRIGNPDAPVVITEYGAYGCHACRQVHQNGVTDDIKAIVEENPDQVQFIFVNFPVISPLQDPISAEAGQCVADLGDAQFWQFHDAVYDISDGAYYDLRNADDYVDFVRDLGIDADAVSACMEARTHRGTVNFHLTRAGRVGVRATPTFTVNNQQVGPFDIRSAVTAALSTG